jgi:hypothetical protein
MKWIMRSGLLPCTMLSLVGCHARPRVAVLPVSHECTAAYENRNQIDYGPTDVAGVVALAKVPPGDYRLVASYSAFCPANVRLSVISHSAARRLRATMRPQGIDECSAFDF